MSDWLLRLPVAVLLTVTTVGLWNAVWAVWGLPLGERRDDILPRHILKRILRRFRPLVRKEEVYSARSLSAFAVGVASLVMFGLEWQFAVILWLMAFMVAFNGLVCVRLWNDRTDAMAMIDELEKQLEVARGTVRPETTDVDRPGLDPVLAGAPAAGQPVHAADD